MEIFAGLGADAGLGPQRNWRCAMGVALALSLAPQAPGQSFPPLTRAADVSRLPLSRAAKGLDVRLKGTVVFSEPAWSVLFLRDVSGTAFVDRTLLDAIPPVGSEVELEGKTAAMGTFPGIRPTKLTAGAAGAAPPVERKLRRLLRSPSAFEWVEVHGVVRVVKTETGCSTMAVQVGDRRMAVLVARGGPDRAESLVDAEVVLTGVLEWEETSPHPPWLWVPSWERVQVLVPPTPLDRMPVSTIAQVLPQAQGVLPPHRLRVRGQMVERQSRMDFTLEDGTGRIDVRGGASSGLARGTGLEVLGFLDRGPLGPRLVDTDEEVFQDPDILEAPKTVDALLPTLRSLAETRALPAERARRGYPVDVTGVVTYEAGADMLFVQDETAAVFVSTLGARVSLRAGQRVRVRGRTAPGALATVIVEPKIEVLGAGSVAPRFVSGSRFATGQDDCHLVEIEGRIRRAVLKAGVGDVVFDSDGRRFPARIAKGAERLDLARLVGARVRMRGICATSFDWRVRFSGVELLVPDWSAVRIEAAPQEVPLRSLIDVLRPMPDAPTAPQVRVRADVLLQDEQNGVFLRDPTGVVRVDPVAPVLLHPGDQVEALGFAEPGEIPALTDAQIHIRGRGPAPDPARVSVGRITGEARSGELVRLSATLNDSIWTSTGLILLMQGTDGVFRALVTDLRKGDSPLLGGLQGGSLLELTGVATIDVDPSRGASVVLLLRSAADVRILATPSWWTAGRVAVIAVLLLAAAAVSLLWGRSLHQQVGRQTAEIAAQYARVRESEESYRSLFQARERLVAELEAKNTELERFSYTVSHDLKAPLITIKGFLSFLEEDAMKGRPERLHEDVLRISGAIDRMHVLLRDLLELSRVGRQMSPPEPVPFAEIAAEAALAVKGRLDTTGARLEIASELPTVFGDRARLTQVVQNLLDNALKFSGGVPAPVIEVGERVSSEASLVTLFVRDNGIGIDEASLEEVFGLFQKLNVETEGTGIGLALVKRIVEGHGGRVWVESKGVGTGATFVFTLPRPGASV